MNRPASSRDASTRWRCLAMSLLCAGALMGCAASGDFGEEEPSFAAEELHHWVGTVAAATGAWELPLTGDEHLLRELADPLIAGPSEREAWLPPAPLDELAAVRGRAGDDRVARWKRIYRPAQASPASRYARLADDIRRDLTRIPPFFETATRVLDLDEKRRKSMALVPDLRKTERRKALARVRENARVVEAVCASLRLRIRVYRSALGHLVAAAPSPQAGEVERLLNELEARLDYYRGHAVPTWTREPSLAAAT
ncbi:MAG: hypothetical protein IRY89_08450 [Pseudolabrys sp.]|nr:hypothetical protein [Pseudolabrys sp.]